MNDQLMKYVTGFLFMLLCQQPIHLQAGELNIQSQLKIQQTKNQVKIGITVRNVGLSEIYDIFLRVQFLDNPTQTQSVGSLLAGQSQSRTFKFTKHKRLIGAYPLITEMQFHDANFYPFFAMRTTPVYIRKKKLFQLPEINVSDCVLSDRKKMSVHIKNMAAFMHQMTVQMILSGAFDCSNASQSITLAKGGSKQIEYEILKTYALPGTDHYGYVVATYSKDEIHHTQTIPFRIHVSSRDNVFFNKQFWLIAFLVVGFFWGIVVTILSIMSWRVSNKALEIDSPSISIDN